MLNYKSTCKVQTPANAARSVHYLWEYNKTF